MIVLILGGDDYYTRRGGICAVLDACQFNVSQGRPYPAGSSPCLHSGQCQSSLVLPGLYTCHCLPGYTGTRCQTGLLTSMSSRMRGKTVGGVFPEIRNWQRGRRQVGIIPPCFYCPRISVRLSGVTDKLLFVQHLLWSGENFLCLFYSGSFCTFGVEEGSKQVLCRLHSRFFPPLHSPVSQQTCIAFRFLTPAFRNILYLYFPLSAKNHREWISSVTGP